MRNLSNFRLKKFGGSIHIDSVADLPYDETFEGGDTAVLSYPEGFVLCLDPHPSADSLDGNPVGEPDCAGRRDSQLVYSTYLGGGTVVPGVDPETGSQEYIFGAALDPDGSLFVVGRTPSQKNPDGNFPLLNDVPGAIWNSPWDFEGAAPHNQTGVVALLDPQGEPEFVSFFGADVADHEDWFEDPMGAGAQSDPHEEWVYGVQADPRSTPQLRTFWISGHTGGEGFATPGAVDEVFAEGGGYTTRFDSFLARLQFDAVNDDLSLEYFTYIGGVRDSWNFGLLVDPWGSAFVAGITDCLSINYFPITPGAFQEENPGASHPDYWDWWTPYLVRFGVADPFLRGDVNHDQIVDFDDVAALRDGAVGTCHDAADVNDDGIVDAADVAFLVQYLNSGGQLLPPPSQAAGQDPTIDTLPWCFYP